MTPSRKSCSQRSTRCSRSSSSLCTALCVQVVDLEWNKKNNDLYEFAQSHDLKSINDAQKPLIGKLKQVTHTLAPTALQVLTLT